MRVKSSRELLRLRMGELDKLETIRTGRVLRGNASCGRGVMRERAHRFSPLERLRFLASKLCWMYDANLDALMLAFLRVLSKMLCTDRAKYCMKDARMEQLDGYDLKIL